MQKRRFFAGFALMLIVGSVIAFQNFDFQVPTESANAEALFMPPDPIFQHLTTQARASIDEAEVEATETPGLTAVPAPFLSVDNVSAVALQNGVQISANCGDVTKASDSIVFSNRASHSGGEYGVWLYNPTSRKIEQDYLNEIIRPLKLKWVRVVFDEPWANDGTNPPVSTINHTVSDAEMYRWVKMKLDKSFAHDAVHSFSPVTWIKDLRANGVKIAQQIIVMPSIFHHLSKIYIKDGECRLYGRSFEAGPDHVLANQQSCDTLRKELDQCQTAFRIKHARKVSDMITCRDDHRYHNRLNDYAKFIVAQLRYLNSRGILPDRIELQGEPDGEWTTEFFPEDFARLVTLVANKLNAYELPIKIDGPGTSLIHSALGFGNDGKPYDRYKFIDALKSTGAIHKLDAVSAHYYEYNFPAFWGPDPLKYGRASVTALAKKLPDKKPIVISEFSAPIDPHHPNWRHPARLTKNALDMMRQGASTAIMWDGWDPYWSFFGRTTRLANGEFQLPNDMSKGLIQFRSPCAAGDTGCLSLAKKYARAAYGNTIFSGKKSAYYAFQAVTTRIPDQAGVLSVAQTTIADSSESLGYSAFGKEGKVVVGLANPTASDMTVTFDVQVPQLVVTEIASSTAAVYRGNNIIRPGAVTSRPTNFSRGSCPLTARIPAGQTAVISLEQTTTARSSAFTYQGQRFISRCNASATPNNLFWPSVESGLGCHTALLPEAETASACSVSNFDYPNSQGDSVTYENRCYCGVPTEPGFSHGSKAACFKKAIDVSYPCVRSQFPWPALSPNSVYGVYRGKCAIPTDIHHSPQNFTDATGSGFKVLLYSLDETD